MTHKKVLQDVIHSDINAYYTQTMANSSKYYKKSRKDEHRKIH